MLLVNKKVSFQGLNFLSFRAVNESASVRKLFTPGWYRVNLQVSKTMLNHNQNLFLIVSACLASLQKFLKGKSDA